MKYYILTTLDTKEARSTPEYCILKMKIDEAGFILINGVKIYVTELAYLFSSVTIPAKNRDTGEVIDLNTMEYLETYIQGYREGEGYFRNEFNYRPNPQQYIKDIHYNFFHADIKGWDQGWSFVKNTYPVVLSHKEIREFGYYAGIVNRVEEDVKTHPNLYKDFEKCNIDSINIKKELSFESLFKDSEKSKEIKKIFESRGYTHNGKWKGISGNKSELLAAYETLKPILKPGKVSTQATVFYKEFGLIVGEYISARSLTKVPPLDDIREFTSVFRSVL